jgi:Flp pilus assembly pilin Flp
MLMQLLVWRTMVVGWARERFDERGASLVEYALLLALIAIVAIGALIFLGHSVSNSLNNAGNAVGG